MGGWRLLTDPTFDPPGRRYSFGWGSSSHKLTGPGVAATDLGAIDAVLLSHDHYGDNLDAAGRSLLPAAGGSKVGSVNNRHSSTSSRAVGPPMWVIRVVIRRRSALAGGCPGARG